MLRVPIESSDSQGKRDVSNLKGWKIALSHHQVDNLGAVFSDFKEKASLMIQDENIGKTG